MEKIGKLDVHMILNKEFNVDFKGYSASEVDAFLDLVIQDYQKFNQLLGEANQQIEQLQRINAQYQAKLIETQGRLDVSGTAEPTVNQVDLLKRLAKLEQEVYSK